jgi:hypothetical protein
MTTVSTAGTAPRPRSPRARLRARLVLAGLSACGLAALAWASFVHPLPRLIYNPSDSVAVGWYRVDPLDPRTGSLPRPLSVDSIVLTRCRQAAALAAQRGYLPARVPLLKRVGAVAPQEVCIAAASSASTACLRPPCCLPTAGPAAAILAAMPPPRTRRTVPVERDQPGVVRQPVFRAGQRIRRDRRRASGLAGFPPMMAADSLHVAVHLIVPSGVSFWLFVAVSSRVQCGAFAPHFALPSAQPSNVQASCLERARPAAVSAFAGALAARAAAPPGRRLPGAPARGKGGRQDKRTRHRAASKASLHMGVARHGAASPPCRVWREARANAGMSACFARPDTPELAGSAAMTDRRDDDFRIRPSAPKNRGQGFVSKVLKQAGKASSGKSSVRRPGGWGAPGGAPASGPARAWGAATRRRASPGRS